MLYQETVSVPLIIRYKGRVPAGRIDRTTLASGMDVLPSLCDLAGVRAPAEIHGASLFSGEKRDSVFAQLAPDTKDASLQGRAVRNDRFKYVSFSWGDRPEMLFDLKEDPLETRDLASSPRFRSEIQRQRALLNGWIRQTGDTYKSTP
jgi:arylsulfatase A-like enzyme